MNDREWMDGALSQDRLSIWTKQEFQDLGFATGRMSDFHREGWKDWDALWA